MAFYIVQAACGHVGKGQYLAIDFPIKADSTKEACTICRQFPRVKHDNKNAIIKIREVTKSEYMQQILLNNQNPFLKAKNKRETYALGMSYEECKPIDELKKKTNWKKRNDKVDENEKQRRLHNAERKQHRDAILRKEMEDEIRLAM